MPSEFDFGLSQLAPLVAQAQAAHLLDIDTGSAFEDLRNVRASPLEQGLSRLPGRRRDSLAILGQPCITLSSFAVCTSSFQHLSSPLRAIRQRKRHNLIVSWEFDLTEAPVSFTALPFTTRSSLTFSRMTNGPFTPPMVLYRILRSRA